MKEKNVVMLVYNYFENDSRVLKEAATLSKAGYRISIFALWKKGLAKVEEIDSNTTVYRLDFVPFHKLILGEKIFEFLKKQVYRKLVAKPKSTEPVSKKIKRDWNKKTELNSFKFLFSSVNKHLTFKGFFAATKSEVSKLNLQPDIVHAHDLNTLPLGHRIAKRYNSKLVYDSHELYIHRNKPYKTPKWYKKWQFKVEKKLIKKCDAVITVSQSIVDYLEKTYRIPTPFLIMNAPFKQKKEALTDSNNLKKLLQIPTNEKLLIYSGGISFNRGLDKLIQALELIPNCHMVFLGGGNKKYKEYLTAVAEENNVKEKFHFYGPVGSHEVTSYIQSADLGIAPIENVCLSYYYCAPNKVFEYIQGEIPVVSSNFPDMENVVVGNNIGTVFNPDSYQEIAHVINEVMSDSSKMNQYKENVKKLTDTYKWENEEKKLLALYNQITHS